MIWLTVLFLILAGIAKGYLDYYADIGIKDEQWPNKWKNINEGWSKKDLKKHHWWYLGLYTPKYHKEKFPLSSTILVAFTDKWHLAQLVMLRFFYLSISVIITTNIYLIILYSFIIFPIVLGIPFEIVYSNKMKKI